MSQMSYFSRAKLVGKNLARPVFATIRSSLRRSNADNVSAVPYFPNLLAGQTLLLTVDGGNHTITFTGNTFSGTINDINTAIPGVGLAFDAGGVIGIQTVTAGATGNVSVTGGSGALNIGFDVSGGPIVSTGGDLFSSPEAGSGNPNGVASPNNGENIRAEAIQRIAGRIAANTDVLYSDIARGDVCLRKVVGWTIDATLQYITLPANTKIFTGGPSGSTLTANSSKAQLSAYFLLVDTATGQVAAPKVMAVTNGTPTGSPPYANTASWVANDGLNILGVDVVKHGPIAISNIPDNQTVVCSGATFQTSGVVSGDFVSISGATNLSEQNNNGYRWVVDQVISETALVLRPMSKSELSQVGTTLTDNQPLVDLSSKINGGESFGSISVKTGNSWSKGTIVLDHPTKNSSIVNNSSLLELWVAQPSSVRSRRGEDFADQLSLATRPIATDADVTANAILQFPQISGSGTTLITVQDFYVRWHGRICRVSGGIIGTTGLNSCLYWDEQSCLLKVISDADIISFGSPFLVEQSPDALLSQSGGIGKLIAHLTVSGPNWIVSEATSVESQSPGSFTVGWGGNFPDLPTAIEHLNRFAVDDNESTLNNGSFPHAELILLSDQTVTSPITILSPFVRIRGAQRGVRLILNTASAAAFILNNNSELTLEKLTLRTTTLATKIASTTNSESLSIIDCNQDVAGGGAAFFNIITGASINTLKVLDSNLVCAAGVAWGALANIKFSRSTVTHQVQAGVTNQQIFSSSNAGMTATAGTLTSCVIDKTIFTGFSTASATIPVFIADSGSGKVWITDSVLDMTGPNCALFTGTQVIETTGTIFGNSSAGPAVALQCLPTTLSSVSDCTVYCIPENGSVSLNVVALQANIVNSTRIIAIDSDLAMVNCVGIKASKSITSCFVTGPLSFGLLADSTASSVAILNNIVSITAGTHTAAAQAGIIGSANSRISGNFVQLPTGSGTLVSFLGVNGVLSQVLISDNRLNPLPGQTCISISLGFGYVISGNTIGTTATTGAITGIALAGVTEAQINSNTILLSASNVTHVTVSLVTSAVACSGIDIVGNGISAGNVVSVADSSQQYSMIGNDISSSSTGITLSCSCQFKFNRTSAPVTIAQTGTIDVVVVGNRITNNAYSQLGGTGKVIFNDNSVTGALFGTNANNDAFQGTEMCGNSVSGNSQITGAVGSRLNASGNYFAGICYIFDCNFNGNTVAGSGNCSVARASISGCNFPLATLIDTVDLLITSQVLQISSSTISKLNLISVNSSILSIDITDCVITDTSAITFAGRCDIQSCVFLATLTTNCTDLKLEGCWLRDQVTTSGTNLKMLGNDSDLATLGWGSTGITINNTGRNILRDNYINAKVLINGDYDTMVVEDNTFNVTDTYCYDSSSVWGTGFTMIRNNAFMLTINTTGAAETIPGMVKIGDSIGTATANVSFVGNQLRIRYSGDYSVIQAAGATAMLFMVNLNRVKLQDNNFEIPADLVNGINTWAYSAFLFDDASSANIVVAGNLISKNTNAHPGAPLPGEYTIPGTGSAYPGTLTSANFSGDICRGAFLYRADSDAGHWANAAASGTGITIP